MNEEKLQVHGLSWLDPRGHKLRNAGVAFYNDKFSEFHLKIDEDPGASYYLKPIGANEEGTRYRMEKAIKKSDGSFLKRLSIGEGVSSEATEGDIHIYYGSKYATLILSQRRL